ncbi:hypothetical protein [Metabacillus iocasae]|uniref:Thioredoxin-related protein n=1 Tax=Priestia iocasae TaxID=2291674 RepID=A0ABS2QV10_9BACI|nr:hypothetical protein [Metabacillus iocasae]MBM7703038.1 thioredoxin-related protein [Metabacillus iocasae]
MKDEKWVRAITILVFILFVSFITANNVSSNHNHIEVIETFKEVNEEDCK